MVFSPRSPARREIELIAVVAGSLFTISKSSSQEAQDSYFVSTSISIFTSAGKNKVEVSGAFLKDAGICSERESTTSTADALVPSSKDVCDIT